MAYAWAPWLLVEAVVPPVHKPTHDRAHKGESPRGVSERTRTRVGAVGRRESDMTVCNESSAFLVILTSCCCCRDEQASGECSGRVAE